MNISEIVEAVVDNMDDLIERKINERLRNQNIYTSITANVLRTTENANDPYNQRCDLDLGFTILGGIINKTGQMLKSGDSVVLMERFGSNYTDCYIHMKNNAYSTENLNEELKSENGEKWQPYEDEESYWRPSNFNPETSSFIMTNWFEILPGFNTPEEKWRSYVTPVITYQFLNANFSEVKSPANPTGQFDPSMPGYPGGDLQYIILQQEQLIQQKDIWTDTEISSFTNKTTIETISVYRDWTPVTSSVTGYWSDNPRMDSSFSASSIDFSSEPLTVTIDGVVYNRKISLQIIVRFTRTLLQSVTGTVFRLKSIANTYQNNSLYLLYPSIDPAHYYIP